MHAIFIKGVFVNQSNSDALQLKSKSDTSTFEKSSDNCEYTSFGITTSIVEAENKKPTASASPSGCDTLELNLKLGTINFQESIGIDSECKSEEAEAIETENEKPSKGS